MGWTDDEVQKVYLKLKAKAMTNQDFRKKLLSDPKSVIEEMTGKKIPDDFKIQIIESNPDAQMAFVLPPMVEKKLSDDDLDNVAGGACVSDNSMCAGNVCGAAR